LRTAADRLFFYDIQRRERTIAADIKAEELRRHRIDNFAKAVKLESIIRDPELRKKYVEGLYNSITPFEDQHPRITSISIDEADESTGASKTKMAGAD
jgi:hypothetical protein